MSLSSVGFVRVSPYSSGFKSSGHIQRVDPKDAVAFVDAFVVLGSVLTDIRPKSAIHALKSLLIRIFACDKG